MDKFLKLFEGMELTPEFQEQLKAVFQEALEGKLESLTESTPPGFDPKLKKKIMSEYPGDEGKPKAFATMWKIHKAQNEEAELDMEEPEPKEELKEADGEEEAATLDPDEIVKDPDVRRILLALKINPVAFARSLKASIVDIEGNTVGDDAFNSLLVILDAIANDSNLATRLAMDLKKKESEAAKAGEEEPAMEEEKEQENTFDEEELMENVDRYITYAAEEWLKENKLAVESGLKMELVESFLGGLKGLFTEHNFEIPEKISVVEKLNSKIEKLNEELNSAVQKNILLKEEVEAEKQKAQKAVLDEQVKSAFADITSTLPVTTKEKLQKLNETIEYTTLEEYKEKLQVMMETVATEKKTTKKILQESDLNQEAPKDKKEEEETDPVLKAYYDAISKNLKF